MHLRMARIHSSMVMYFRQIVKKGVPARGLEEISDIARCLSIPITAIGGITPENTGDVLTNGVSGIAVMSGIISSSNPYSKAKSYKESIRKWAEKHV